VPPEEDLRPEIADVGRLVRRGIRRVVVAARADQHDRLGRLIREHLAGGDGSADGAAAAVPAQAADDAGPGGVDDASRDGVVQESWPGYEHVNVQAALNAWLAEPDVVHELVGVVNYQHRNVGLAELLALGGPGQEPWAPQPGTVSRVNLPSGPDGQVFSCVRFGIYLLTTPQARLAILMHGPEPESGLATAVVQVIADRPGAAAPVAARIRQLAVEHNVFRGQVLSFGDQVFGAGPDGVLQFHSRPRLPADHLILPAETLATIRRQAVGVARHSGRLLASGQHLKRGLLLYGPPGAGKTHTVRHLLSELTGTTVVQVSGQSIHLIGAACSVARSLQPAMVVVEDVDLIAEDRGMHPGQHPMLFQLLNEMDGLAEDADVVFVLTTNRADLLEPALAARPGRVDQAVELSLPDAAARRRLFALYRGGLRVDTSRLDDVIGRTEGVTASFLKELLRRAALFAAERDADEEGDTDDREIGADDPRPLTVTADDLDAALEELLSHHNAMTRVLLGSVS
jgi:hypothetical protein